MAKIGPIALRRNSKFVVDLNRPGVLGVCIFNLGFKNLMQLNGDQWNTRALYSAGVPVGKRLVSKSSFDVPLGPGRTRRQPMLVRGDSIR